MRVDECADDSFIGARDNKAYDHVDTCKMQILAITANDRWLNIMQVTMIADNQEKPL